jgi:molecular chaperone GrpE
MVSDMKDLNQEQGGDIKERDIQPDQSGEEECNLEDQLKTLQEEMNSLCEELSHTQNERDQFKNAYGRLKVDFDNFRRRKEQEISELKETAVKELVISLLPVIDNLERALVSPDQGNSQAIRNGVDLVLRQFMDVLQKAGVLIIPSVGEVFDPNVHEAAERVETPEYPPGTVVEELLKGYSLKGKVLRASMVKVAAQKMES